MCSTVDEPIYIPAVQERSLYSTFLPTFVICVLSNDSHSDKCEVILILVLICISLMISNVEHLSTLMVCWPSLFPLWKNIYSVLLPIFLTRLFGVLMLNCMNYIYVCVFVCMCIGY